ncbi:endonuclease/exonuclease/phosphatase family protein [Deinococcus fonticola]|uniref:endonuclease/exonuclease/phosphatase family protein n=1 Tax=Deinococcus fonticola TaxID=2528713 RepID=UPI00142F74F6|nr:endonuclease/exonuclease/phosphatase family protein [Deinococcus fonticola]
MKRPPRLAPIRFWSLLFILVACGWWWVTRTQAGTWWWAAALNVVPPQVLLPIPLFMAWLAGRARKQGWVLLNVLAAAVFTVSVAGFVLPRAEQKHAGLPLTLLTLNTNFAGTDPARLAQVALREGVQVITLQEALNRQVDPGEYEQRLRAAFPGWSVTRYDELVTISKFPILSARSVKFPNSAHAVFVTQVRAQGQVVDIVNMHLPAPKLLPSASDRAQNRNVQERLQLTLDIRRDFQKVAGSLIRADDHPLIIAGDLNAPSRGGVWYQLRSLGLRDAFRESGRGFGFTHHALFGHSRIDYVWLRGAKAGHTRTLRDLLSDHRAVVVKIMLPETESGE